MKRTLLVSGMLASVFAAHANALLKSPVSGALGSGRLAALSMASDGKDVVLLLADNTSLYALDIKDNDPSELVPNAITSIPDFVNTKLKPVAGGATLTVIDMEVNPVSRAVYVLAESGTTSYVFKVRKNGADITLLDLSSVSHSTISWGGSFSVNDMTWGDNKLFASSGSFSLNGSVVAVAAPFTNGATVTQRKTSMFKSNWGGTYFTSAPLETMTFGVVGTKSRLMGVTTCAPGYSLEAGTLSGSGTLEVKEYFNVNMGVSEKVVFQRHDSKDWLFDLHDDNLYRIGASFLDGTSETSGKYNKNSVLLRDNTGAPVSTLTADQFKQFTGTYSEIAFWDNYRLLVLEKGGTLKLMQTAATAPPLSIGQSVRETAALRLYPNPAHEQISVTLPAASGQISIDIYALDGRRVQHQVTSGAAATIDLKGMPQGQYLLKAVYESGSTEQQFFVIQ
ncbi:MAG: T9SS type A sorting domain-containing protein [Chitinophagaceae bacterium]